MDIMSKTAEKKKDEADVNFTDRTAEDVFSFYNDFFSRYIDQVSNLQSQYLESVNSWNTECTKLCEKMATAYVQVAKEYSNVAWGGLRVNALTKIFLPPDAFEGVRKMTSTGADMAIASIDAVRDNIRFYNDTLKSFDTLNGKLVETWQTMLQR